MKLKVFVRESALALLVVVAAYSGILGYRIKEQGSVRLSEIATFGDIHLGMQKDRVASLLGSKGIDCREGKNWTNIRYCTFDDPWRRYVVDFDDNGIVSSLQVQGR